MTMDELERALLDRAPAEPAAREKWERTVARVIAAARPPESFEDLAGDLPPKPRYVGPGPWLDAIRDSWRA